MARVSRIRKADHENDSTSETSASVPGDRITGILTLDTGIDRLGRGGGRKFWRCQEGSTFQRKERSARPRNRLAVCFGVALR